MISSSAHFSQRKEQRGLRQEVLDFILEFGKTRFARKATWLMIDRKSLPPDLRNTSLAIRAAQWLILVEGEALVTCYRSASPARNISRSH